MINKSISVIIPCTRPNLARETINSILPQLVSLDYEIIVIGPGLRCLKDDFKGYNITITDLPKISPSAARNLGAKLSKHDILIFIDDDCEVLDNFVENYLNKLKDPSVGAVSSKIIGKSKKFFAKCTDYSNFFTQIAEEEKLLTALKASFAIRKSLFEKLSGFDEDIIVQEDVDFARRIVRLGLKVVYCPEAIVLHNHHRDTFSKVLKSNFSYGLLSGLSVSAKHKSSPTDKIRNLAKKAYALFIIPFALHSTYLAAREITRLSLRKVVYVPFIFVFHLIYQIGILNWVIVNGRK